MIAEILFAIGIFMILIVFEGMVFARSHLEKYFPNEQIYVIVEFMMGFGGVLVLALAVILK
jgi:hypothetical protein